MFQIPLAGLGSPVNRQYLSRRQRETSAGFLHDRAVADRFARSPHHRAPVCFAARHSTAEHHRIARLFIRMPGYRRNMDWAIAMDKAIAEAAQNIHTFPTATDLLKQLGKKTHEFYATADPDAVLNALIPAEGKDNNRNALNTYGVLRDATNQNPPETYRPYTSIFGPYLPYLARAKALLPTGILRNHFHAMDETIGEAPIKLTSTVEMGENNYAWNHTHWATIPTVLAHVDTLFKEALKLETLPDCSAKRVQAVEKAAAIHWWLVQAMPFIRGSAGISDVFTKVLLDYLKIPTSPWRADLAPDLEAFVTPLAAYVKAYPGFFEKSPLLPGKTQKNG